MSALTHYIEPAQADALAKSILEHNARRRVARDMRVRMPGWTDSDYAELHAIHVEPEPWHLPHMQDKPNDGGL